MLWAKQSTAVTVIVGPVLDSAGAEYASAVIADMSISKNGGTLTAMAAAATLTYIANGMYTLVTRTTDFDTLGRAQVTCNKSTYQMPKQEFMVLPATVYDALVTNATNTTGGLPAATAAIAGLSGTIATTTNITAGTITTVSGNVTGSVGSVASFGTLVADVATAVWAAGTRTLTAISDSSGITTLLTRIVGTLATGTHNPQSGDAFARIGANGAGLTSLGDTRIANLDAAVSSRMATYVQPAGFLAATFPGTVASTTNITAGTITAVTGGINTGSGVITTLDALDTAQDNQHSSTQGTLATVNSTVNGITANVIILLARIPSGIFTGMTSVAQWLGLIAGKQVGDTTARTEIRATGAASGTFNETTDSIEAIRDRGDAAWVTGSGGSGGSGDASQATLLLVKAKTDLITAGRVVYTAMTDVSGEITRPIHIGDDYLDANSRAFTWEIDAITGLDPSEVTVMFGGANEILGKSWLSAGSATDLGGLWKITCELTHTDTAALEPGLYDWTVEVSKDGTEITKIYTDTPAEVRRKRT